MTTARRLIGVRQDASGRIGPVFADVTDAVGHHRAVVDALRAGPMMPLAFGADPADRMSNLREWLAKHEAALADDMRSSRDLVEMGVRIRVNVDDSTESSPPEMEIAGAGRGYLQRASARTAFLAGRRTRAEEAIAATAASPGVARWRVLSDDGQTISLALAVRRDAGTIAAARLAAMSTDGLSIETSGPWPLYSFG
ncbi:MAG: GvpL/GvpF family gas vesicle protein, partial [Beijerinckiaceae bacterium]